MRHLLVLLTLFTLVGCSDFTYGRTLEGEIINTGSRVKATETGMQQKISIVIKASKSDAKMDEVATGPSGTAVECLSTRCSSISVATCHRFKCKYEYRFNEPNIIACKHDKEIECQ